MRQWEDKTNKMENETNLEEKIKEIEAKFPEIKRQIKPFKKGFYYASNYERTLKHLEYRENKDYIAVIARSTENEWYCDPRDGDSSYEDRIDLYFKAKKAGSLQDTGHFAHKRDSSRKSWTVKIASLNGATLKVLWYDEKNKKGSLYTRDLEHSYIGIGGVHCEEFGKK